MKHAFVAKLPPVRAYLQPLEDPVRQVFPVDQLQGWTKNHPGDALGEDWRDEDGEPGPARVRVDAQEGQQFVDGEGECQSGDR